LLLRPTRPLKATIRFGNAAPTSGDALGTGTRSGPCSLGGDLRARPRSYITLGDEGLYLGIFRYRSPDVADGLSVTD
jgi:hypothetical protein